ncbi:MAG TPA: InlB B-repeat-containing protein [Methanocorpusculum sp.]|nr:InlB B-repeat-containing protein [Methanocorpusculum sp.]
MVQGGLRRVVLALAVLLLTCVLMAGAVSAADGEWHEVTTFKDLKSNLTAGNLTKLAGDITIAETISLTTVGDLCLDLNGYNITGPTTAKTYTFEVKGPDVNLTIKNSDQTGGIITGYRGVNVSQGELTVQSGVIIDCTYAGIYLFGSTTSTDENYSVATIEKGATIKGQYGVVLYGNPEAYGAVLDVSGSLIGKTDDQQETSDGAFGIFVSGNLKKMDDHVPEIIIRDGASLTGASINGKNGQAIAGNGYANITIYGGTFTGDEALGVKGGKWTIYGGTFTATGAFSDPAASNNNGAEATGAAVSVTTNKNYAQNVELTITGGTFISEKQSAFYEGPNKDNSGSALRSVTISGGSFTTGNESLSAVTLKNEGNEATVSIQDEAGNNLLYRGVNLTNAADWTVDATNGYTLVLDKQNAKYKLMDGFTTTGSGIQITADGVTLDGDKKKITTIGTLDGYIVKVAVGNAGGATGVTLQNLDITGDVASATGNYGGITVYAGEGKTSVPVILKGSIVNMSEVTTESGMNPAVYFVNAPDSQITDNEITAGNTKADGSSTPRAIVVADGSDISISKNEITMGTAKKGVVSHAIQFQGPPTGVTISGNEITATSKDSLNRAVSLTTTGAEEESYVITGNTLTGETFNAAVHVIIPSSIKEGASFNLEIDGNTFTNTNNGVMIAKYGTNGITLSGKINTDDFPGKTAETIISADEGGVTLSDAFEWTHDPEPSYSSSSGNMNNAYRVLFNDGSTTLSVQTDLSSGDKLTKPETPVKDGYTFAGWYKDSACTQPWDFETGIPGDMTLYAKWTAAGSSGETEATTAPTATSTAVTTPQPTKTQSTTATTSAPQATTAAGVSPTLTQAPAPVAGALFGLLAAGVLLRRRFQ